jgi:hypothetical protein
MLLWFNCLCKYVLDKQAYRFCFKFSEYNLAAFHRRHSLFTSSSIISTHTKCINMLVNNNLTEFYLLALAVHCLTPFQPNDKQNVGTNSDLLLYIIQKYYLQIMYWSVLCLLVPLCTITPREVLNTSLVRCSASHHLLTSHSPRTYLFC